MARGRRRLDSSTGSVPFMGTTNQFADSGWGSLANWQFGMPTDNAQAVAQQQAAAAAAAAVTTQQQQAAAAAAEAQRQRQSALEAFQLFFANLGINFDAEIQGIIMQAITDGYTPDDFDTAIIPKIQQTNAFKTRFSGYDAWKKLDGSATIGQYLRLEGQYKTILSAAGMPAGFYDDPSDFGNFIAKGISPDEVQARVNLAVDAAQRVDPTMRSIMSRFYGLATGDVAAYFLDPNRSRGVIEHQYRTAGVASWAARHGFAVNDIRRYEDLATSGVTAESAMQGYGTVRALSDTVGKIASVYGETFTQSDAESDVFFNNNEKRQRIVRNEQATFSGRSSGSTGSAQRSSY